MYLNITEDFFPEIFDDFIQIPNTVSDTNPDKKDNDEFDWSQNTTTSWINSFANPFTTCSESSLNVDNYDVFSTFQTGNSPKVPSMDASFDIEVATNSPNKKLATLKPTEERVSSPFAHPNDIHFLMSSFNSNILAAPLRPKNKRRSRAKKILGPSETLRAREKYIEIKRRASRKYRSKKKAEMATDQEKHDFCVTEINATKNQLLESQKELLSLIEICKGMVGKGCSDAAIRKFIANWERREETYGEMLESGDVGIEVSKLIQKCRSARLGEGVLGDAAVLEVDRGGLMCGANFWEVGAGCEAGNGATMEYGIDS